MPQAHKMIHIHIPSILSKTTQSAISRVLCYFQLLTSSRYICFIAGADVAPVVPHGK